MTIATKTTAAAFAALMGFALLTTTTTNEAQAGDAAAAIGGFAVGTLFGAAVSQPRYYDRGPVVVYERPAHRARVTRAGVSRRHARRCAARYRSYDWNSNTWVDYHGRVRVCR